MAAKNSFTLLRSFQGLQRYITLNSQQRSLTPRFYSSSENSAAKPNPQSEPIVAENVTQPPVNQISYDKMRADLEALNKKHTELMDKYMRALADSENMRVRWEKRTAEAKIFGIQSFGKDLIEVADNLHNATASVSADELETNKPLKTMYDGLNMTLTSLMKIFKRHGLETMNPLNTKFDPHFHEALFVKVDPSVEPNTVIEVAKLGYKIQERCIRPALVGVSKAA